MRFRGAVLTTHAFISKFLQTFPLGFAPN
jgi:hypothetical protein